MGKLVVCSYRAVPTLKQGTVESLCEQVIASIEMLIIDIGLPNCLRDMDIRESACAGLAAGVMKQARLLVNSRREVRLNTALRMYQDAW